MSIVPHKSPLLWSGGVAARETLSYLDRRGIDAEPALSGAGSRPAKVSPITRAAGNDSDQTDKGHATLYTMSVIAKHHGPYGQCRIYNELHQNVLLVAPKGRL